MSDFQYKNEERIIFTKEMKKTYKILIPNMLPIHFELLRNILIVEGYDCDLLKYEGEDVIKEGLKYTHNDMCYPCLLVVGQFIYALKSKKYDVDKTALLITQTGGGCRASNYIHILRKALKKAGFPQIPVISINLSGLEKNPGFKFSIPLIKKLASALLYGDMIMNLYNQTMPYEIEKGSSLKLKDRWVLNLSNQYKNSTGFGKKIMTKNFNDIVSDFSNIKINKTKKVRVGIVGEIYVKYSSTANNNIEKFLHKENVEVIIPGILNFIIFKADNRIVDIDLYGGSKIKKYICVEFKKYLEDLQKIFIDSIKKNKNFKAPASFEETKKGVLKYLNYGVKMGEGWLLTAEILELINSNIKNIICVQPFGCLPNHIVGKGMIRKILNNNENVNIITIDYDPGATKINQENRIKLMLASAKENLK